MSDKEHRIDRDRTAPTESDDDAEALTCEECGRSFDDEEHYREHVDREKREQLRGSEIGDAILGSDRWLRR